MLSFKHYDYTHSFPYFQFHFIFLFFFLLILAQTNKSPPFRAGLLTAVSVPRYADLFSAYSAVCKIKVNQRLIRNTRVIGLLFEIINCVAVNVYCNLFFQLFSVRVFLSVGKIVFSFHFNHSIRYIVWILFLLLFSQR